MATSRECDFGSYVTFASRPPCLSGPRGPHIVSNYAPVDGPSITATTHAFGAGAPSKIAQAPRTAVCSRLTGLYLTDAACNLEDFYEAAEQREQEGGECRVHLPIRNKIC